MFEGKRVWIWEEREEGEVEFGGEREEGGWVGERGGVVAIGEVVGVDYLRWRGDC